MAVGGAAAHHNPDDSVGMIGKNLIFLGALLIK
jgi:hypothetical protein